MRLYALCYGVAAILMLGLDAVWLGTMGSRLYRPNLGDLMLDGFRPAPAIAFYLLYVGGIVVFAVAPALADLDSGQWIGALWRGALLGLFCYGTYDLTNQATLKAWPLIVTIVDLSWGCMLTATVATLTVLITRGLAP